MNKFILALIIALVTRDVMSNNGAVVGAFTSTVKWHRFTDGAGNKWVYLKAASGTGGCRITSRYLDAITQLDSDGKLNFHPVGGSSSLELKMSELAAFAKNTNYQTFQAEFNGGDDLCQIDITLIDAARRVNLAL